MVKLLLQQNADPEVADDLGRRPIHWYAIRSEIAAMREILQHGLKVNVLCVDRIHDAATRNRAAVKLLLEHGAEVGERDIWRDTSLHLAAKAGKIDVMKFLVEQRSVRLREKDQLGWMSLLSESVAGKLNVVQFLVQRWPGWTTERWNIGFTPLHWVAAAGKIEVLRYFVERWPERIKETNKNCRTTPLHLAATNRSLQRLDIKQLLVEQWPQGMREKDKWGQTPLHLAAQSGRTDMLRLLAESWPEGKEALGLAENTPLSFFEDRKNA